MVSSHAQSQHTDVILVSPQRPTSLVRRPNTITRWGYPRFRNIYKWMGKTEEETSASCAVYSAGVGLGMPILFED